MGGATVGHARRSPARQHPRGSRWLCPRGRLPLLAHGAPLDLLADVQRAASDEVRHARLCYELAGVRPGRMDFGLPIDQSIPLDEIAAAAVREGGRARSRAPVRSAVEAAFDTPVEPFAATEREDLVAHGLLGPRASARVAARALEQVVEPARRALLASVPR